MRRYLPLLLISFFLVVIAIAGTTLLAGHAGKQTPENRKNIVIYTALPLEQVAVLAQEYEKTSGLRVSVVPVSPSDILTRLVLESGSPRADIILANRDVLDQAKKAKLLAAYTSEQTDVIPERFADDDSYWTGIWYDPIIFAVNQDFLKKLPQPPAKWADLAKDNYRLAITDFLAADASANLLYTLAAIEGETETLSYFAKLHPRIVQYAKFLATPPRMAGMGEADVAVAVHSESLRYVKDGFPLKIIFPEDGTAYLLTGVALNAGAPHDADAKRFIDWIVQEPAQIILNANKFFLIPTNPEIKLGTTPDIKLAKDDKSKEQQKPIELFEYQDKLTAEQKAKLLDKWVQTVRLGPK